MFYIDVINIILSDHMETMKNVLAVIHISLTVMTAISLLVVTVFSLLASHWMRTMTTVAGMKMIIMVNAIILMMFLMKRTIDKMNQVTIHYMATKL